MMRRARLALVALLGSALLAGCLNNPPPPPPPAPVVEKPRPEIKEQVILLPSKSGKTGAVVVRVGNEEKLLDKPYATAEVKTGKAIETRVATAEEVRSIAKEAVDSLPILPVSFMLLFEVDSAEPPASTNETLDLVEMEINRRQQPDVSIIGHADSTGTTQHNQVLSEKRAQRIYDLLLARGAKGKINVVGKGDSELLVPTKKKKQAEAMNRRVEIVVR